MRSALVLDVIKCLLGLMIFGLALPAMAKDPTPPPKPSVSPKSSPPKAQPSSSASPRPTQPSPSPKPSPSPSPAGSTPIPAPPAPASLGSPLPLFPGQSESPTGSARIVGRVLNQDGVPIGSAQITLESPGSSLTATTDAKGGFELSPPQTGNGSLKVSHPDYEAKQTTIWLQAGLTTPIDVSLNPPIATQPRIRLGVLGVGGLETTQPLSQRLALEAFRLGLIPQVDSVVALDNRRLLPILRKIGVPLYELFERDRAKPEAVQQFFDVLGLKAIVIARVDILSRPSSATDISLQSRSSLELWSFDSQGKLGIRNLDEAGRSQTENMTKLGPKEISQLYQIQVTQMGEEMRVRWQQNNPLAAYFDPKQPILTPSRSQLDTTVELLIPPDPSRPSPTPQPSRSPGS